jgi:hypothetical protein
VGFFAGIIQMKQNSYYFSHDYNAANDVKVLFLRQQLGMEGYGIYWYLVEALASAGGSLPLSITPVLSMQMQVPEVKVLAVISNFSLFTLDKDTFFSQRLNDHLSIRQNLSDKGKQGAYKRWNNREAIGVANGEANTKKERKEINKEINLINKIVI